MKTVFVTGGLGVIGSHVVRAALAEGHRVVTIDRGDEPRNLWLAEQLRAFSPITQGQLTILFDNLLWAPLNTIVKEADFIVHAAAHTGIPHSAIDPEDDWRSNVDATRRLLEVMRTVGSKAPTVLMSSVKPYATHPLPPTGIDETALLDPDEPYAASKMAQSALGVAYARTYDLPVTVLRFSNLYGPAPCHGPRHGWLTWFCICAAIGRPIEVQGDGLQIRDMLYADDVVNALDASLGKIETTRGNVYNVGGGKPNVIAVHDAAEYLQGETGIQVTHGPARKNDDRAFFTNHSKFTKATGWLPKVRVKDGIAKVFAWAQEHRDDLAKLYEGVA